MKEKKEAATTNATAKNQLYDEFTPQPGKNQVDLSCELELLRGFPPKFQKKILTNKITEIKGKLKGYEETIKEKILRIKNEVPEPDHIVYISFLNLLYSGAIAPLLKRRRRLLGLRQALSSKNPSIKNFELLKEQVKQRNIVEVAKGLGLTLKRRGKYYVTRCPFHNDKTPSFCLYPNTNTFFCFGCGEHGDNVNLQMKLTDVDFKTALQELAL